MEIKFNAKDSVRIPDGCKAIIEDGMVIFVKEEKEQEFKNGDILCSVYNNTMVIFKEMHEDHSNRFYTHYNTNHSSNEKWNKDAFRLATEEEKRQLFDKMKEKGWQWNAEKKCVELNRWRAKKGKAYCRIGLGGGVFYEIDRRTNADNVFYDTLNYFHTEEQTREAIKRVRETLQKYHEEIGE